MRIFAFGSLLGLVLGFFVFDASNAFAWYLTGCAGNAFVAGGMLLFGWDAVPPNMRGDNRLLSAVMAFFILSSYAMTLFCFATNLKALMKRHG